LAFDIPNWVSIIIEIGIGIAIAIGVYKLQARTSKLAEELLSRISFMTSRVDSLLEQRRVDEQSKKAFECRYDKRTVAIFYKAEFYAHSQVQDS
jgi:hypothetical protein